MFVQTLWGVHVKSFAELFLAVSSFLFAVEAEADEAVFVLEVAAPFAVLPLLFPCEGVGADAVRLDFNGVKGAELIAAGVGQLDADGVLAFLEQ